jgi:hypothetical protein
MTVRAKFRVNCVVPSGNGVRIDLHPVYDSDPNSENGKFFNATPWGHITLGTMNAAAAAQFTPGAEFYVDFMEIPK